MTKKASRKAKVSNHDVWSAAVEKATNDKGFRAQLLRDPHGVLSRMGGKPEKGVSYSVLPETAEHRYLVLPHSSTTKAVTKSGDDTKSGGF